jgi:RNA-directed DNA polymerase
MWTSAGSYADDIVLGFQVKSDAERFWAELVARLRKFALELHPEKTRLLELGPYAAERRRRAGLDKPETFNFLGFTHICATQRSNQGHVPPRGLIPRPSG